MKLLTGLVALFMMFGIGCSFDDSKKDRTSDDGKAVAGEETAQDEPSQNEPDVDEPKQDEPAMNEPKQNEPAQDEPKQDEPAQDEPKQDEPAQDEPKQDEPDQGDNVDQGDKPSQSDEPAQDEPKQDEPAQDEPKQDEPAQDEPKQDEPAQDDKAGKDGTDEIDVQSYIDEHGRDKFITLVEERINALEPSMTELTEGDELRVAFEELKTELQALRDATDDMLVANGEKLLTAIKDLENRL